MTWAWSPVILGAGYINFGFNVINRIADGLGVALPESPDLNRAASLLLKIGYRPLSGRPFARFRPRTPEALDQGVAQIALTAVHGPGVLQAHVREQLFAGEGQRFAGTLRACRRRARLTGDAEDEYFLKPSCAPPWERGLGGSPGYGDALEEEFTRR